MSCLLVLNDIVNGETQDFAHSKSGVQLPARDQIVGRLQPHEEFSRLR
jgi:hypothetical protein